MAKVGIVTFHSAHNFGAVLQCLALKTVLRDMGHDVSVIDHRNPKIEQCYSIEQVIPKNTGIVKRLRHSLSLRITYRCRLSRYNKYERFIETYILSPNDPKVSIEDYDCIVWGSDQIWRWDIIGDDLFYWGECGSDKVRKIAYAASAGKMDSHFNQNIKYLKGFKAISVREPSLKKFLESEGYRVNVTLDPSLLLTKRQWEEILDIPKVCLKPYILVYSMRNRNKVMEMAQRIAKRENVEIKEIFSSFISPRFIMKEYGDGGPLDFIALVRDAKYVVTDSFHGTAFSMIFNRQFITVRLNDGHDGRAEALLDSTGLSERMKESIEGYEKQIDYSRINNVLEKLRSDSIAYLKNNIDSSPL